MSLSTRREFLGALGTAASIQPGSAAPTRPNILFIMADEFRWNAMGCAGHPVVKTPTLDSIARQGMRFSSCYTVSPVCSPSRASAFTGRHRHVHGLLMNGMAVNNGEIFLPSILKHYGYHTAICGKLHFRPIQYDFGFDQFWSFSAEGPTPEAGYQAFLKQKYGSPGKWPIVPGTCPWPDDPLGHDIGLFKYPHEDFETEWLASRSIDYLRSRKASGQPWFLFTSFLKPHSPSVLPDPWFSMYDPKSLRVPKLPPNAKQQRAQGDKRHNIDDQEMERRLTGVYYGAITHVDLQIGRIMSELDKLGMASNTLLLFTADHGNMLGDKGHWFKGLQYDGAARIPLLWRGPKGAAENKGGVVEQAVDNTDLVPSILETAGLPIPQGIQGRSFLKLARAGDADWKPRCYSELRSGMVLENGWKLIDNSRDLSGTRELYDLRHDPQEERDLSADRKQRDRCEHLARELAQWRKEQPPPVRIAGMATPRYAQLTEEERRGARPEGGDDSGVTRPRRKR
jgi:arylsulfatase A-like enzyme